MHRRSIWKCLSVTLVKKGKASSFPSFRFLNSISTSNGDSDSDDKHSCSEKNLSRDSSDSILKCFGDFGFSQSQVHDILSSYPEYLRTSDPQKTISPKMSFLRSRGIPEADVVKIVTRQPKVLARSLKNHLIPSFDLLTTMLGSEQNAISMVTSSPSLLSHGVSDAFALNLSTLKNLGFSWSKILKLMNDNRRAAVIVTTRPDRFREVVESVMQMGFDASSSSFGSALCAMGLDNGSYWKGKFKLYQSLGFTDKEILYMFRKEPNSMVYSAEKIRGAVEFFCERFHWSPSKFAMRPHVMESSMEKKVIPRCSVLQVLWSKNKIGKSPAVTSLLVLTEKVFLETYVTKYEDEVPEVLDAYQGKLHFDEYTFDSEEAVAV